VKVTDNEQVLALALSDRGYFVWLAESEEEAQRFEGRAFERERRRVSPWYGSREAGERALALKAEDYGCAYLGAASLDDHERQRAKRETSAAAEEEALPLLRQMRPKDLVALFDHELGRLLEEGVGYEHFRSAKAAERQIKAARRQLRGVS
jgi:hypothetical protein